MKGQTKMKQFNNVRVRKTIPHGGSVLRPQHFYVRLTSRDRSRLNRVMGGFKHFMGADASGADAFAAYGLPAMERGLKELIASKGGTK
jgi:hypothetical protein